MIILKALEGSQQRLVKIYNFQDVHKIRLKVDFGKKALK